MKEQLKSLKKRGSLVASLCLVMLMSSCANAENSGIETKTACKELGVDLPSASKQDTQQTKEEIARYLKTFEAVCGGV